jgi:transcriptional regulator with XRE-family HTH domain
VAYTKPDKLFLREFGQHVRKLREAAKWTQEELAERSGLHRTYIGSIERGERNLALLNIRKVANAFSLTLSEFLDEI